MAPMAIGIGIGVALLAGAGGVPGALSGRIDSASSVLGSLKVELLLSGSVAALTALSGAILSPGALIGAVVAAATLTGVLAGAPAANEVPWTSETANPRIMLEMGSGWLQKSDGSPATTPGDKVDQIVGVVGGNAIAANTAAGAASDTHRGTVGPAETIGSVTAPVLTMGAGVLTNRYLTPVGSYGAASGAAGDIEVILARVKPPAVTGARTLLSNNGGNFNYDLNISNTAGIGQVSTGVVTNVVKTDTSERWELYVLEKPAPGGNNRAIRINDAEALSTAGTGNSLTLASGRAVIGNVYGGNSGAEITALASYAIFPQGTTRANIQRHCARILHKFGLAALIPADSLYKTAPPTMPAGTTTVAAAQGFNAIPSTYRQTWLGGMYEGTIDSYEGGFSVPPTDTEPTVATASYKWGFPFSLNSSGAKGLPGLRSYLFGGASGRPVATLLRFPLGSFYRGARLVNAISGLIERFGERYPGQNASVTALLSEVLALGGGLCPSFWTLPPHWTTNGSISGVPANYIWAGGSYSRSTRLDTLFDGDATALANAASMINDLTSMIVELLEYLHQNVAPVRMFALQNEAGNPANAYYGHIHYSAREYVAIYKRLVEKIRASSILSTYGGQPNTVRIIGNSWDGAQSQPTVVTDTEILTTGKTLFQEHYALATHDIAQLNVNGDNAKTTISSARSAAVIALDPNFPVLNDEYWGRDNTTDTEDWEATNSLLKTAHFIVKGNAGTDCYVIHGGKPTGQIGNTGSTNAKAYGAVFFRRPAPFDQDPATAGDPRPDIGYGEWAPNPRYGMSQQVWKWLKPGSRILTVYNGENTAGRQTIFALDPDNKLVVIRVNHSSTDDASPIDFGKARVMKGYRCANNLENADIATLNASIATIATPAKRVDAWVEQ